MRLLTALTLLPLLLAPARGGDFFSLFDAPYEKTYDGQEVRIGALYHGVIGGQEQSADVNFEYLSPRFGFDSGNRILDFFTRPRFQIGTSLNTNSFTSMVYAGLASELPLFDRFFFESSFGAAYNDGATDAPYPANRLALGCSVQFHESFSLGYDYSQSLRVMTTFEHSSNAGICDRNAGINNLGVRLGYKF